MTHITLGFFTCLLCWANSYPTNTYDQPQPDGYFQYINVPGQKEYEFGWNKGNPHHYISRFEQAKDHRFRTRVKWADTHDGYGEHYWEYNHAPKHDGYGHEQPVGYHSENVEVAVEPEVEYSPRYDYPSEKAKPISKRYDYQ